MQGRNISLEKTFLLCSLTLTGILFGFPVQARANFSTFQDADLVLGQNSFETNSYDRHPSQVSADGLYNPYKIHISTTLGKTFVADYSNHRVLVYNTASPANGQAADVVLGQANFTSNQPNRGAGLAAANSLSGPISVFTDGVTLYVADTSNQRVLIWNDASTLTNGQAANRVLGFTSLTGSGGGSTAGRFTNPYDVSVAGGKIFVADYSNHRVMIWNSTNVVNGQNADVVVGQPTLTSNMPNQDPDGATGGVIPPTASTLYYPTGVFSDGNSLLVADTYNYRALMWDTIPSTHNVAADRVLGQPNFSTSTPPGSTTASNLSPYRVGLYGNKIFVASYGQSRLMVYNTTAPVNGQAATWALGAPDLTTNGGGSTERGLTNPMGFWSDGTRVWVADLSNHRIVSYPSIATFAAADREIGHLGKFNINLPNAGPHADGLYGPYGMATDGTRFYLSDYHNHRVLIHNNINALSNGQAADYALGQPDLRTPHYNNNGGPGGPLDAFTLYYPQGIASDGKKLFVSDYSNNRVLWWNSVESWSNGKPADGVLGHNLLTESTMLTGGARIYSPSGIFTDGKRLFLSNVSDHRVLVWNDISTLTNGKTADLVLGQANLTSFPGVNRGAGVNNPTAGGLYNPNAIYSDGRALYVADYGNGRVLLWNNVDSLADGQNADVVLGKVDMSTNTCTPAWPTAECAYAPYGLVSDGKRLFMGEYQYRILIWNNVPTSSGAGADMVLGASSLTAAPDSSVNIKTNYASQLMLHKNHLFTSQIGWQRVTRFSDPLTNYVSVQVSTLTLPASAQQSSVVAMYKVTLNTAAGSANWSKMRAKRDGGADADIEALQVYLDNGDGTFDEGADGPPLASGGIVVPGTLEAVFSPTDVVSSIPKVYFVVMKLKDSAALQNQAGLKIVKNNYFFDFSDSYVNMELPIAYYSGRVTITEQPDALQMSLQDMAPDAFPPSTTVAMAKMTLSADHDQVKWTKVRAERGGTSTDGIATLRVYRDNGDGVFNSGTDTPLSGSFNFVNGVSTVTLSGEETITTTSQAYFLAANVSASPSGSFYVKISAPPIPSFSINNNFPYSDTVNTAPLPFQTEIPPAAVTTLTGTTLAELGELRLTWNAPGKDDNIGALVAPSSFTIQYTTSSTFALWSATGTPLSFAPRVVLSTNGVNPGDPQAYTLTGLSSPATYYLRVWTADETGRISLISNGAIGYTWGWSTGAWQQSGSSNYGVAWGDSDNDGDLDLLYSGYLSYSRLLMNNGNGSFTDGLWTAPPADGTSNIYDLAWGDYDADGDLDFIAAVMSEKSRIYRNDGGNQFTLAWKSPQNTSAYQAKWGDYDNDGDLDFILLDSGTKPILYRNDGNDGFTPMVTFFALPTTMSAAWGDYDNDGDLDLLFGVNNGSVRIYRNAGNGVFETDAWVSAETHNAGDVAWGDYDNDGDLDMLVGNNGSWPNTVYRNNNPANSFMRIWYATFTIATESVAWGDYDNDGDLDQLVGVYNQRTRVFKNNGDASFTQTWNTSMNENTQTVAWGDYDDDGDLDFAMGNYASSARIYGNDRVQQGLSANTAPGMPSVTEAPELSYTPGVNVATVTFRWNKLAEQVGPNPHNIY
ncbi:MAG: VCBS repeat-containing protein, partial [Elusimicrobia bacterium]|nr:VCBS repeat-containing protein [Elusimicrobiota bacterium]